MNPTVKRQTLDDFVMSRLGALDLERLMHPGGDSVDARFSALQDGLACVLVDCLKQFPRCRSYYTAVFETTSGVLDYMPFDSVDPPERASSPYRLEHQAAAAYVDAVAVALEDLKAVKDLVSFAVLLGARYKFMYDVNKGERLFVATLADKVARSQRIKHARHQLSIGGPNE